MQRRTRKSYESLFDNPSFLFGTAEVFIFPGGRPEIQVSSRDGKRGIRITANDSLAGFSLEVIPLTSTDPLSIYPAVTTSDIHSEGGMPVIDQSPRVSIRQYPADSRPLRLTRKISKLREKVEAGKTEIQESA